MRMRLKTHAPHALVWSACETSPSLQHSRCRHVPVLSDLIILPPTPTFPSGGLGIRCSCFIRWRYSSLGPKFYFCLIPRDFGPDCGRGLLKGLRRYWSQDFAILLGAMSVWTRIDADSARCRRSAILYIGRSFFHNDTQLSAQILLTSHSSLRSRTFCLYV